MSNLVRWLNTRQRMNSLQDKIDHVKTLPGFQAYFQERGSNRWMVQYNCPYCNIDFKRRLTKPPGIFGSCGRCSFQSRREALKSQN